MKTTVLEMPVVVGASEPTHEGSTMELNRSQEQSTYTAAAWGDRDPLIAGGVFFTRSRGTSVGQWIATQDGDQLGEMEWFGSDAENTRSMIAAAMRIFQVGAAGSARVKTRFVFQTGTATENCKDRFSVDENVVVGDRQNLLPTDATNGFLYIPAMAGRPTGTPEQVTGGSPICSNVSQNELCVHQGGAWRFYAPVNP